MKICGSGQYRIRLPVTVFLIRLPLCRPPPSVKPAAAPSPSNRPGTPRRNDMDHVALLLSISTSRRLDSALTTDAPTPCSPPVATYEPPPNLPPACSFVNTTSTPDRPVFGALSTG